jgi:dienelactone hydrolase
MTTRNLMLILSLAMAPIACRAEPTDAAAEKSAGAPTAEGEAVVLRAADGVAVHGQFYPAAQSKATILLFHQAGSSKDEYATIAPRLVAAGFSALAIDQRSGGELFGPNLTVKTLGGSRDYGEAAPDLHAAIDWAKAKGAPVIVWGSSYSSALVFPVVAAKRAGDIAALLAFSPDEYIEGESIGGAAAKLRVPLFVTSAKDGGEIAAAKAIFDASPSPTKIHFIPKSGGVHGSSTLIAARNAKGAEENWAAVLAFLAKAAP